MTLLDFYKNKKVFITGHTGFKGAWLCRALELAGAQVTGYALESPTAPSLFEIARIDEDMTSVIGDVRDRELLGKAMQSARPELVFHLAAQPIVRVGYKDPVATYETNVMGTVNLLESVRRTNSVRSVLNVTTDKVYKNIECSHVYRENEELNGFDPYSNSKSCSELVTGCYINCFFSGGGPAVSTARAGNVIGGGDFAPDRIIPDCVRSALRGEDIAVRNPHSIRPYQHVLESLFAYLTIVACQYENAEVSGSYNVGPDESDCCQTGALADMFVKYWGEGLKWVDRSDGGPREANFLMLDCAKLKSVFGWHPRWSLDQAVEKTVEWTKVWAGGGDARACMDRQIGEYLKCE